MKTKHQLLFPLIVCIMTFISCKKPNAPAIIDARNQYVGSWQIHDTDISLPANSNYVITIAKSTVSDSGIEISNFYGQGVTAFANVSNTTFIIPKQTPSGGDVVSGNGVLNGNSISFSFTWYANHKATGIRL